VYDVVTVVEPLEVNSDILGNKLVFEVAAFIKSTGLFEASNKDSILYW